MSLPDYLLDDPSGVCPACGRYTDEDGRLCYECIADMADTYADEKISEGGRR